MIRLENHRMVLVLGGARSGKSALAEDLLMQWSGRLHYIATAEAFDDEMTQRIADHRTRRGGAWALSEAPLELAAALRDAPSDGGVLVDCLTLWLSNLMFAERDIDASWAEVMETAMRRTTPTVFVSNEVGMGLVPETALGRRFRDAQGRLNQSVATSADLVIFVAAGLPLVLKDTSG